MKRINKEKAVLVTGATGYVAGWIVKKLLDEGFTVHATVRDPQNTNKLKYLHTIAAKSSGILRLFKADLLQPGSFDEAMKDCELVFHTASPFINKVKNPQRDLVDPALIGTQNVLESVNKIDSVQRVVLTSSSVAIIGDAIDCETFPNGLATEAYWNTTSSVEHQPYNYSKVIAERAAWEMNKKQDRWDLVTINPSLVIGPGLNAFATSESFNIVKQIGDGSMKFGLPEFYIGVVDVRDLAEAHFKAGFTPTAHGRYIISAENTGLLPLAGMLKKKFGTAYPFPSRYLPKPLVWLLAPLAGFKRKMISRNVGYHWRVDNSKSIQGLGVQYRPIEESIVEMFQQLADKGIVKKHTPSTKKNNSNTENYIQYAGGYQKNNINNSDIDKAIKEIQQTDDEHGAFWVSVITEDENVIEVSKYLSLRFISRGTETKYRATNWDEVKELYDLLLLEKFQEIKDKINIKDDTSSV